MPNLFRPSANETSPVHLSRLGCAFEDVCDQYRTQFTVLMMLVAIGIIHFFSTQIGLGTVGDALFSIYLVTFAIISSVAQTGKIPFAFGIEQPVKISGGCLLQVFCAAISAHMKRLSVLPAERIASTAAHPYFIQPAQPGKRGLHVCLTNRLLAIPPSQPRN
jgi:hypothetical protein